MIIVVNQFASIVLAVDIVHEVVIGAAASHVTDVESVVDPKTSVAAAETDAAAAENDQGIGDAVVARIDAVEARITKNGMCPTN